MINELLPQRIDNTYHGHKLALWIFALVVSVKTLQGLMVIFNTSDIARSADGFPLDTFAPAAAQAVVGLFALLGLSLLILSLLCILVLVRYRSAISFMFTLLVLDYLARQLILHFIPVVRIGKPPGLLLNFVLFSLMIVGTGLSLWNQHKPEAQG
jgi:hypothetical protein